MKCLALVGLAALVFTARPASAQQAIVLPIGGFAQIDDPAPTTWAIGGIDIVRIHTTVAGLTPIMRTQVFDARTVEILSRTQTPPLRASDIKVVGNKVVVRRYLLMTVTPPDAHAVGTSIGALVQQWASSTRRALPQIAPSPSRFGV